MYRVIPNKPEIYKGETYRTEKREIASFYEKRGYRIVWCWEIKTGPAKGEYGGKCATKAEAVATVKRVINGYAAEAKARAEAA